MATNVQRFGQVTSVHVTETCDDNELHVITHVETTEAGVTDSELSAPIHAALAKKNLLPQQHFMDSGYVDADLLVKSQRDVGIEVIGPVRPDSSWQAHAEERYDVSHFPIHWETQQVVCPQGKMNTCWTPHFDAYGNPVVSVKFARTDCRLCPARSLCTRSVEAPRHVTLRTQAAHQILQRIRVQQTTTEWKDQYKRRAGIEGTISQGTRAFGLRRSRSIGQEKTHLQHVLTAGAINLVRFASWKAGVPHAKTRTSRFAALKAS